MRRSLCLLSLIALLGCPAEEEPPPEFNFIPLHDDVCEPGLTEETLAASQALDGLVQQAEGKSDWVVRELSLCGPDSCEPCAENPLMDLFGALDGQGWFLDGLDPGSSASSVDYVNLALQYPVADLIVHVQDLDGTGLLTLTEGREMACDWLDGDALATSNYFALQPESLSEDCSTPTLSMQGAQSTDGWTTVTQASGSGTFGFLVPMVPELPDPAGFATVQHVQDWVAVQPHLAVRATDPEVEVRLGGQTGCFEMTAQVPVANLFSFWADDAEKMGQLAALVEAAAIPVVDDRIELVLAGWLHEAGLVNGMSATPGGDQLSASVCPDAPHDFDSGGLLQGSGSTLDPGPVPMVSALYSASMGSEVVVDPAAWGDVGLPTSNFASSQVFVEGAQLDGDTAWLDVGVTPLGPLEPGFETWGLVQAEFESGDVLVLDISAATPLVSVPIPLGDSLSSVQAFSLQVLGSEAGSPFPVMDGDFLEAPWHGEGSAVIDVPDRVELDLNVFPSFSHMLQFPSAR